MQKGLSLLLLACVVLALLIPMGITAFATGEEPVITKVDAQSQTVSSGNSFTVSVFISNDNDLDLGWSNVIVKRTPEKEADNESLKIADLVRRSDGKYEATFSVTDEWIAGEYTIDEISLRTNDQQYVFAYADDTVVPNVVYTVQTGSTDTVAPSISKVEAETNTYYLGDTITITVSASDPSGVDANTSHVSIVIPNNKATGLEGTFIASGNDEYKVSFKVDSAMKNGDYMIEAVNVCDKLGNRKIYSRDSGDSDNIIPASVFTVVSDEKPAESPVPSESIKPSESPAPSEPVRPSESPKPADPVKPDEPEIVTGAYSDVPISGTWYSDAVYYAAEKGYMTGTGNYKFNPTGTVTRGTIAQILYAAEGKPAVSGKSQFMDVGNAKWYAEAVKWAADKGLVSGYGNGKFGPENAVTREQMLAIMYKYSEMKGYDLTASANLSKFTDQNQISKYAVNAMKWGVAHKVISGTNKGIEPKGNATRAQIAVILQAYDKNVRK